MAHALLTSRAMSQLRRFPHRSFLKTTFVTAAWVTTMIGAASDARADAITPDVYACSTNPTSPDSQPVEVGTPCVVTDDVGKSYEGTCVAAKCTEKDYTNWDRDAEAMPPTKEVDCLRCVSDDKADDADASTHTGDAAKTAGDGTDDTRSKDTNASASKPNGSDDGGCSVGRSGSSIGPWALAFGVALLATKKRRRDASNRT